MNLAWKMKNINKLGNIIFKDLVRLILCTIIERMHCLVYKIKLIYNQWCDENEIWCEPHKDKWDLTLNDVPFSRIILIQIKTNIKQRQWPFIFKDKNQ